MIEYSRFSYHFEPRKGWMNDPNGLIFYKGQYHIFFQHYPHDNVWGQMHWGHAVSDDLLHWKELPIALYPDQAYEDDGGCFSGSAIEKDGRLYLLYTSVSHEYGQTQSVAWSDDGIHFTKHPGNPVIRANPLGGSDFRDPKVTMIGGTYHMVVGTGDKTSGKVLLFTSDDLLQWNYSGVLYEDVACAPCMECPDFFPLGDKYVLMFSKIGVPEGAVRFAVGDFVDGKLVNVTLHNPEQGPDFYAAQTFAHGERRIQIGWMYHWGKTAQEGCPFAGALSIPRELSFSERKLRSYPVAEAQHLLKCESRFLQVTENLLLLSGGEEQLRRDVGEIRHIAILEDSKSVEVFVNGGECSFTYWLAHC